MTTNKEAKTRKLKMTQSHFIKNYCARSNISESELNERGSFAVICDCDDEICVGWAMVTRTSIVHQVLFCIKSIEGWEKEALMSKEIH